MANRHNLPGLVFSGFILAVAGCQSGDGGATLASGGAAAQGKVLESELRGYCPPVTLREGTAFFSAYAKGGQDDPSKLQYQASITEVTRACSRSGGNLTINVAVAGRVVPGPAGAPRSVTMPIRVVVLREDTVLYSKLQKHPVSLGGAAVATQFVVNDPNVRIPDPRERGIQVFAGFDEGPAPKAAAAQ